MILHKIYYAILNHNYISIFIIYPTSTFYILPSNLITTNKLWWYLKFKLINNHYNNIKKFYSFITTAHPYSQAYTNLSMNKNLQLITVKKKTLIINSNPLIETRKLIHIPKNFWTVGILIEIIKKGYKQQIFNIVKTISISFHIYRRYINILHTNNEKISKIKRKIKRETTIYFIRKFTKYVQKFNRIKVT